MSIKSRLILLSLSFTLVIGIICALTMAGMQLINKKVDDISLSGIITKNVFELNIVTYQYLIHSEERMQQQWLMKYRSLGELLKRQELESDNPEFTSALRNIRSDYKSFGELFIKIQANLKIKNSLLHSKDSKKKIDRMIAIEERLVTHFLMMAHRIVVEAYMLSDAMKRKIIGFQEQMKVILLCFSAGFILAAGGISYLAANSIIKPISELVRGVKIIGAGNLQHKLTIESQNEVGELSRAFDQMMADIQRITVSRNELNQVVRERTNALRLANAELIQYTHVVSHDLKAPLRAIRNYSDFLREDLEGKLDGDQKAYLDGLNRAVNQGEELVNDLLTLAKIGKSDHTAERIEIGPFIHDLAIDLSLPASVKLNIDNDMPVIEADRVILAQIFKNLIDNAVKFNNSEIKHIRIGCRVADTGGQEIFVQDNGIGIEDRFFEKIFQVFQRLHTRDEYEGTGIGLAIVKKVTEKLGWGIRIESEPGEGSTFCILIPPLEKEHGDEKRTIRSPDGRG